MTPEYVIRFEAACVLTAKFAGHRAIKAVGYGETFELAERDARKKMKPKEAAVRAKLKRRDASAAKRAGK